METSNPNLPHTHPAKERQEQAKEVPASDRKEKLEPLSQQERASLRSIVERFKQTKNVAGIEQLVNEVKNDKGVLRLSFIEKYGDDLPRAERESLYDMLDVISRDVLNQGAWKMPDFDRASEDLLKNTSKVEMIVHPLFSIQAADDPQNATLWKQAKGNTNEYLKLHLQEAAARAYSELRVDPKAVPESYLAVMELVQELQILQKPPAPGTVRVLVLPRRSQTMAGQRQIMDALLRPQEKHDRTFVIDSVTSSEGLLDKRRVDALRTRLPKGATVEFHGGYLLHCLDGSMYSVEETGRKDLRLTLNFDGATYSYRKDAEAAKDVSKGFDENLAKAFSAPDRPAIRIPRDTPQTLQEVIDWIVQNKDFNAYYKRVMTQTYTEQLRERKEELPDRHPDPKRINIGRMQSRERDQAA